MEKVIAVQNNHYEKLNQLENLLMDNDGSCKKAPVPTTAEMRLYIRRGTLNNVLEDLQQNNTPSNHSVL